MASTSSITIKFGEDRTTRARCRCETAVFVTVFVCHESEALCVRWVHSSNKHCVAVYRPISTRFSGFFMRPSSLGGGRILRRTLSVCLSVRPVIVAIGNVFS